MKTPTLCDVLVCAVVMTLAPAAGAQHIFKCVEGEETAYQSTPCAPGVAETRMAIGAPAPRVDVQAPALSGPPTRQPSRNAGPWKHTTLTLGMSDDEVLNMRGWGRPSRITRVKVPREWREEWVYGQPAGGEHHLHFANAKLVDIVFKPPVDHLVQISPQ